jgi:hypothetical protein
MCDVVPDVGQVGQHGGRYDIPGCVALDTFYGQFGAFVFPIVMQWMVSMV